MKKRFVQIVYVTLLFVVTAVLSLSMTSCDEGGIDSQVNNQVNVGITAQASYTVSASVSAVKFTISSNTPWTISSDQSWCKVTPVSSTVSAMVQEVTIETEQNIDAKSRTAIVTVSGEGAVDQKITVVQEAKGELNVSMFETSEMFDRAGGNREFTIYSNKAWTITSDKAWLTFDVTSGEGSDEVYRVKATVAENGGNLRRAVITIKTNTVDSVYQITQDGNQLEVANIADTNFNGRSTSYKFQVNSNLSWKAEVAPECDWLKITGGSTGVNNGELIVEMMQNSIFTTRVGKIYLKPATTIVGMQEIVLPIRQGVPFWTQGAVTFDKNGAATLNAVDPESNNRIVSNSGFKFGTFIWKFSSFEMGANGTFNMNAWPDSGTDANFNFNLSTNTFVFTFGPGFDWDQKSVDMTGKNVAGLKELKMDIDHDPNNADKIRVMVYFNGEKIMEADNKVNVYKTLVPNGIPFYFGFSWSQPATCVIDSFTVIPRD